ncbi:DUF3192 domain-containing protein [Bowmanella sp. JS7-9]|uniref:DUF3192 domain-containing protein n=1 Tax=Pseudobowmanella zhangzhouensis TaxID=1537679 RepID=A0ABW1XII3_9ALTE|nr:DUF3192 domain-containing protein [Bowmanella sp. JS7-9]TBX25647.1 lipoprotein [Bowmanella sp. JS7-9]
MYKLVLSGVMVAMLSGCVISVDGRDDNWQSDWEAREEQNRRKITQLQPGMNMSQVQQLFGLADFNESYEKDGKQVQVLFYRTNRNHGDGKTTKDECTPIVLRDGVLVGWGETAYSQL